jgi:ferredoxin-NADP reductase
METTETRTAQRSLLVAQARREARSVVSLTLVDEGGDDLPAWSPGAHIDLVLPSGLVRQYSLCGDPNDRTSYTIAVLREEAGRGGSAEVHDTALVGRTLDVRGPRNHFTFHPAPEYVFLAGGIGITPILPMIRAASACGTPWTLHYGGRDLAHMAFREQLHQLYPGRVRIMPQDREGMLDLEAIVTAAPASAVFYCCGPEPMLEAVERACTAGSPPRELRVERFAAKVNRAPLATSTPLGAFEVELARSGVIVPVRPDRTLLDVVREVRPDVAYSCEAGFCGACETRVLAGEPEHHDEILSEDERAAGDRMLICVGRSRSPRLVLDL